MIDFTNMTNNPKHESKCETAIINHCKGIYCFVFDGGFFCEKYWHHRDTKRLFVCLHLCFSVYIGHGVRCNRNALFETAAVGLGQFLNVLSCFAGLFRRSDEQVANACLTMGWLRLVGCLKIYVSLQNIGLFCRSLLQKRPIFLSILLIVATPYSETDFTQKQACLSHKGISITFSKLPKIQPKMHQFSRENPEFLTNIPCRSYVHCENAFR